MHILYYETDCNNQNLNYTINIFIPNKKSFICIHQYGFLLYIILIPRNLFYTCT